MKEALPKVGIHNSIIAKFVEEINSKYGMSLIFTTLEPHEVAHWTKTFQVASGSNQAPRTPRLWQAHEEPHRPGRPCKTVTEWPHQQPSQLLPTIAAHHHIPPQVQVQQEEINRLINVAAQWSAGDQQRVENSYNAHRHRYTCNCSNLTCPEWCQTLMIIFITTTRADKVTILNGKYLNKGGLLMHPITTLM